MPVVGYLPYRPTGHCAEAGWLAAHLGVEVCVAAGLPALNDWPAHPLPSLAGARDAVRRLAALPAVVAEGPAGLLWAAVLRTAGFAGQVTVLPYLNPHRWYDVAAAAVYRRFADPRDRVYLGSTPSAAIYRALGVKARVGEPYGIDDAVFAPRAPAAGARSALGVPPGRLLLFAGRAQPDKDVYRLLRVGLKARLLFPDLQVVVASHVVDQGYLAAARERLAEDPGVHFVAAGTPDRLADLYNLADVFVTAAISHFETFGRAPAEALACGSPVVAPRYDGFVEVLAQPGGTLVEVGTDPATGAPVADEAGLLRAVYEVLSAPDPPRRGRVAAAARSRFGRSATIRLLDHLTRTEPASFSLPAPAAPTAEPSTAEPPTAEPPTAEPPAAVEPPGSWREPLAVIVRSTPEQALSWFFRGCDHDRFGTEDEVFSMRVRRALCRPAARAPQGVGACH